VIRGDTVRGYYADAQETLDALERIGISYDDVVQVLEDEGVEKFATSWSELFKSVDSERRRLADA
jgi:transaldolase